MRRSNNPLSQGLLLGLLGLSAVTCVGPGDTAVTLQATGSSCAPLQLDATRLLRQLSLDLRGIPPTFEEVEAVSRLGRVPQETIDQMLLSEQFLSQARSWHAELLWPNLDGFLVRAGSLRLTRGGVNPETTVDLLDRRTTESVCPATGTGNLTSVACCIPMAPNHPSCCMARNARYNPADPACIAKSALVGAMYTAGSGTGDRVLRGGSGSTGCDDALEYPPPRVPPTESRFTFEASGRPYYFSIRSERRRYYYDTDEVPLPYDDWTHCPNYCRAVVGTGLGGAFTTLDFVAKRRTEGGRTIMGDGPTAVCPEGYTEVVNPCDNLIYSNNIDVNLRVRREGFRLTRAYWSDNHIVKVCAYEAQERTNSLYNGLACMPSTRIDASCGCGPNGVYCTPSQGYRSVLPTRAEARIRDGLNDEPLRIVSSVIERDEDYYNAYTTRRSFVTGPLSFMYRQQVDRMTGIALSTPVAMSQLPDVPYSDETWHEYVRGPEHSGVLTTPAFLGRFPTWRARINQFRTNLLCHPFEPPASGLPPPDDICNREPNLAQRCGCQHCHTAIEPLGAYWGRWAERSTVYLNPLDFPARDPNCAMCAITGQLCTARCRNNYVTSTLDADGSRYAGTLFGYLYRSPEETRRLDQGPSALVANALSSGEIQSCTVRTAWKRLVGRAMSPQERTEVLPVLVRQFEDSHHSYRGLIRAIVSAPAYRRID